MKTWEGAALEFAEYTKLLIAPVAIADIPSNVRMFLSQASKLDCKQPNLLALSAAIITCAILIMFVLLSQVMLSTYGITVTPFTVLGGVVVLIIALDMLGLLGSDKVVEPEQDGHSNSLIVGIFPLSVPMFAGPGAIAAIMVCSNKETYSGYDIHDLIVLVVIISSSALVLADLLLENQLNHFILPVAQVVFNRLIGMVVGALGVAFILEGLGEFFSSHCRNNLI